jgi:RNA polymerase sigma-70 factor (ECF subfamily)
VKAALDRMLRDARAAWPRLPLSDDVFALYVAARIKADTAPAEAMASLRAADLYLACACDRGVPGGLAAFDAACIAPLAPKLARLAPPSTDSGDLLQLLRARLFGLDGSGRRRIREYRGTGSLARWVRAVAVRLALNLARGKHERPTDDDALAERLIQPPDAEIAFVKARYRPIFAEAFREAVHTLVAADLILLRQYHLDGLSLDELGILYGTHRTTVFRRLGRIRQAVLDGTRARVQARVRVDASELDSLLRAVGSRLDVALDSPPA